MKGNLPDSIAFIGIGSNMGEPAKNCLEAIRKIISSVAIRVLRGSSLYRTEPVGNRIQAWFVNCVIEVRTSLAPRDLLNLLQGIESEMGRVKGEKWGPRVIDLDILFYGQAVIREDDLQIPHPELHKRRFVLVPLNEVAPYTIHPAFGISVKGLLDRLQDPGRVEKIEAPEKEKPEERK